jgi:hypothetical protein
MICLSGLFIISFTYEVYAQTQSVTVNLTLIATNGHYPTQRFTITYYESNDALKEIRHHGNGKMTITNVKPNSLMKIEVKDIDQPPYTGIYFWASPVARTVQFNTCTTGTCDYTYYYISNGGKSNNNATGTVVFQTGLIKFIDLGAQLTIEYLNKTQPVLGNITIYSHMATNNTKFNNYQFDNTNNFMFHYVRSDLTKSYWVFVTINNTTYNYFWSGQLSDIDKLKNFLNSLNDTLSKRTDNTYTPLTFPLLVVLLVLGLAVRSNYHLIISVLILVFGIFHSLALIQDFGTTTQAILILSVIAAALLSKYLD